MPPAVAQTFSNHGGDQRIQTYALSPRPLHQSCVKGFGNSLSPLAAGGGEGAWRRNRIAKFLERQQAAPQSVAVRHAAGNVGKFDQVPPALVTSERANAERVISEYLSFRSVSSYKHVAAFPSRVRQRAVSCYRSGHVPVSKIALIPQVEVIIFRPEWATPGTNHMRWLQPDG